MAAAAGAILNVENVNIFVADYEKRLRDGDREL